MYLNRPTFYTHSYALGAVGSRRWWWGPKIVQALGAKVCDKRSQIVHFSLYHMCERWGGLAISQAEIVYCTCSYVASKRSNKALLPPHKPRKRKKSSHRMFRHMHGVLNKVYLQNFLHKWAVNRETNLISILNPWFATVMLQYHPLNID